MYLIVDPDGLTALCLSKELEKTGMRGLIAKTTEKAHSILNTQPDISVLITETISSGIDGVNLAARIKARKGKVIGFSAKGPDPNFSERFDKIFEKPFADFSEIVNYIRHP